MNNEELIKACIRGDQLACKQLYDRFAPQMYALCLRYTQSDLAAQDVLHDGFIKVFDSLHKLRDVSALGVWIRSIMINTAINNWYHEHHNTDTDDLPDNIESSYSTTSDIYSSIDIKVILDEIRQLTPAYRMAFNLCEIEGYDFDAAAKKLGIKTSSVRANLVRAKQILALKLSKIYKQS